jgi:DNA-binding SARP family transcriptional activator
MEFCILGPLEARVDGRVVDLGKGKERALLALLLLQADRVVSVDRLVDELWGEQVPGSAPKMVQIFVSQLRKQLPDGVLQTRAPGYRLALGEHELDLHRFQQLASEGREALRDDRNEEAAEKLQEALALWRGPALAEFAEPFADVEGARLAELQLTCLEDRIDADLASGRHNELVGELDSLVRREPLRERLRAQLMLALYRAGRHAEALESYQTFRHLLADELGIEPSSQLKDLERLILQQDPQLAPRRTSPPLPVSGRLPARLAQAAATEFVGRDEEFHLLQGLLDGAATGDGAFVVIAGEGGIGKTRLIAELAAQASQLPVLYGRCDEDEVTPFGLWAELLTRPFDETPDDELEAILGGHGSSLARLIPELRTRVPTLAAAVHGDPEDERRQLFAAVAALVEQLAERQPLLILLDDLHWADRSSLLLLRQLAGSETLGRVLIVGTYRDTELPDAHPLVELLADLERDRPAVRVALRGFDTSDLEALVATWRGGKLPPETVEALARETGGNPFFIKQLVRHLEELPEDGRPFMVPAGLRDVIVKRVARLPGGADRVLKIAALIGREFELDLLQGVAGLPEEQLLDVLDAAVQAGILVEVADTPGRYSFAHALLRTTLEQELTATRRARLHAAIGVAIEGEHGDDLEGRLDELARHFAAAGSSEADRAVTYSVRASEHASARLAYDEAAAYVATALALRERSSHRDPREIADLRLRLGVAISCTGRWEQAREIFAGAAEASREADADSLFARAALGHSGASFERFGLPDQPSADLLEEALRRLPSDDTPLRAQVLARLGAILYYLQAPVERQHALSREALDMARRLDDVESLARALVAAQYAHWHPGEQAARLELAHELVATSERLADTYLESGSRIWRAVALLDHCMLEEADGDLERFAEIAAELRRPELLVYAAAHRAMRALLEGRWEEGELAAAEVLALGEHTATPNALQSYGVEMLQLRNEQLRLGELADHYLQLVETISAIPAWRSALAWAHVQGGSLDLARSEIDLLRQDDFALLPRDANLVVASAILGHIAGELGDADLAAAVEPLLRPSAPYWVVMGYGPATLGPVAFTLGLACQLMGRLEQAVEDFELALELCGRMRARPYLAHTQIHLAQVLEQRRAAGDAARARALREEGLRAARELDMVRLLRDADHPVPTVAARSVR